MRIISGKFKRRKLAKSDHLHDLRPTTDYARENIFNILSSNSKIQEIGFSLNYTNILDVCCGSGAVAFEAISRGAKFAHLIEKNPAHIALIEQNCQILGISTQDIEISRLDATKLPSNNKFYDLVFVDPPYSSDITQMIDSLIAGNWLQKNAVLIIEIGCENNKLDSFEAYISGISITNMLELLEKRKYGSTIFYFFYVKGGSDDV